MKTMILQPKVTFIMPAYNAEATVGPSVNSILDQTYRNLEIIVVNDGSTDNTAEVVEELSREDSRVHLLTIDNGGPANARNAALDTLDGSAEYIMFCDADDFLKKDMVERLVAEGERGADFVIGGFSIVNPDGSRHSYHEPDMRLDPDSLGPVLGRLYKANLLNQVWGKLFRSEIIFSRMIRFPDYRWGEDRFFVFDYLSDCYSVSVLSYCGYDYIMHKGQGLINGFFQNKADVCVLIDERMEELCRKYNVNDDGAFRYMFAKSIFSCMATLYSPSCTLTRAEKRNYIWSIISDEHILNRCHGVKGSAPVKALVWTMNTGSISLNQYAAASSALFSRAFPNAFRKLKHKK